LRIADCGLRITGLLELRTRRSIRNHSAIRNPQSAIRNLARQTPCP